jgi:general secretion pathway protein A
MYCEFWKLKEPPFENVVNSKFVYLSEHHEEALLRLFYTVKGQKGACMLTGEVGSGKTTVSQAFLNELNKDHYEVGWITDPDLPSKELLQQILHCFNAQWEYQTKIELLHALEEKLLSNLKAGKESILIIDEAHLIRKEETYEQLRLLLNFQKDNRFLLTLILVGQPELKEAIRKIPQFEQRIAIKYHLEPLSFVDMCKYIHFRLKVAGREKQIFSAEAAKKIYLYSEGLPRRINTICDMSLLEGFVGEYNQINNGIVDKVIQEEG